MAPFVSSQREGIALSLIPDACVDESELMHVSILVPSVPWLYDSLWNKNLKSIVRLPVKYLFGDTRLHERLIICFSHKTKSIITCLHFTVSDNVLSWWMDEADRCIWSTVCVCVCVCSLRSDSWTAPGCLGGRCVTSVALYSTAPCTSPLSHSPPSHWTDDRFVCIRRWRSDALLSLQSIAAS